MDIDDLLVFAEELKISDADQRRHVENIHIAITTLIIASFVTPLVQETISELNIELFTNILFAVAVVYLSIRLIDITISIRSFHASLDWIFGFIAPLGFLFSILAYFVFLGIAVFDIQISTTAALLVLTVAGIVSVGLSIFSFIRRREDTGVSPSLADIANVSMYFEDLIFDNPEIVEQGLSFESSNSIIDGTRVDIVGRDKDGKTVFSELKIGDIDRTRALMVVKQYESLLEKGEPDETRFLLITSGIVNEVAKQILNENSFEIKTVDVETGFEL